MQLRRISRQYVPACSRLLAMVALSTAIGCTSVFTTPPITSPQSILKAADSGPDRVTLEIFIVRVPAAANQIDADLWKATDELRIPVETRRKLVSNGFRVGVLGSTLPDSLVNYLNLQSEMPEVKNQHLITDLAVEQRTLRRVVQLKRREPVTIQTSEPRDNIHVMLNTENGLQGRSYQDVQGIYSLRSEPAKGQRVRIQLTPELNFGELRNRWSGSEQGVFLVTPSRERKLFDELRISLDLSVGEFLMLGCMPDASGSLGDAFHATEVEGSLEKKLVLVRLLQVPASEILADSGNVGVSKLH